MELAAARAALPVRKENDMAKRNSPTTTQPKPSARTRVAKVEPDWTHQLHLALRRGETANALEALQNGADPNVPDPRHKTPVRYTGPTFPLAQVRGWPAEITLLVRALIDAGADVNAIDKTTGNTPLMQFVDNFWIVGDQLVAGINALVEANAITSVRNHDGWTARDISRDKDQRNARGYVEINMVPKTFALLALDTAIARREAEETKRTLRAALAPQSVADAQPKPTRGRI